MAYSESENKSSQAINKQSWDGNNHNAILNITFRGDLL